MGSSTGATVVVVTVPPAAVVVVAEAAPSPTRPPNGSASAFHVAVRSVFAFLVVRPSTPRSAFTSSAEVSASLGSSHTMPGTRPPDCCASATVEVMASASTPRTANTVTGTERSRSVTAKPDVLVM